MCRLKVKFNPGLEVCNNFPGRLPCRHTAAALSLKFIDPAQALYTSVMEGSHTLSDLPQRLPAFLKVLLHLPQLPLTALQHVHDLRDSSSKEPMQVCFSCLLDAVSMTRLVQTCMHPALRGAARAPTPDGRPAASAL